MSVFGRRSVLRGLAAAPAAAAAMAEQMRLAGAAGALTGTINGPPPVGPSTAGTEKFWSLATWLKKNDARFREDAKAVYGIDPDIVQMALPLNTKVRMQRARNYERLIAQQKNWFERALDRHGVVEWWS